MKTLKSLILAAGLLFLAACSGSDFYLGDWKATNLNGDKFDILFEANRFSITDTAGEQAYYEYSQNSVSIENGERKYGIKLSNGRFFTIIFPISKDTSKGVIADENGNVLFTIGREDYLKYDDVYKLNQE